MKKYLIKTSIAIVVAGILFFFLSVGLGLFEQTILKDRLKILSDGAFVIGVLFVGVGLLVVMSGQGAYDSISYSIQKALSILPYVNKKMPKTLFEYKQEKLERQQASTSGGLGFVIIAGAVWIVVAIVFVGLQYI